MKGSEGFVELVQVEVNIANIAQFGCLALAMTDASKNVQRFVAQLRPDQTIAAARGRINIIQLSCPFHMAVEATVNLQRFAVVCQCII